MSSRKTTSSTSGCKFCGFTQKVFGAAGYAVRRMAEAALSRDGKRVQKPKRLDRDFLSDSRRMRD
jgi:hypothetical protein